MGILRPKLFPACYVPGSHHVPVRHGHVLGPDPESLPVRRQRKGADVVLRSRNLSALPTGSGIEECDVAVTTSGQQFSGIASKFYDAAKMKNIQLVGDEPPL